MRALLAVALILALALVGLATIADGKRKPPPPPTTAPEQPPPPPPPPPPTVSVTRLALVLINFQNDTSQPWTLEQAQQTAFAAAPTKSAASYYNEASHGQRQIVGDVFGYWTIPFDNSPCDTLAWKQWVQQHARDTLGISLVEGGGDYDHIAIAWPWTIACNFGSRAGSFYNGQLLPKSLSHEIGHSFNLGHANRLECVDGVGAPVALSTSCMVKEYGDIYDTMGGSNRHFNGWEQVRIGWMTPTIAAVSGRYIVAPLNQGRQVLYVPRPDGTLFTVEFRQPYGIFDNSNPTDDFATGVMIRVVLGPAGDPETSFIDSRPETETSMDGTWKPGETLVDPLGGSLTVVSVAPSGAVVDVEVS